MLNRSRAIHDRLLLLWHGEVDRTLNVKSAFDGFVRAMDLRPADGPGQDDRKVTLDELAVEGVRPSRARGLDLGVGREELLDVAVEDTFKFDLRLVAKSAGYVTVLALEAAAVDHGGCEELGLYSDVYCNTIHIK